MAFRNPITRATELTAFDPVTGNEVDIEPSGYPSIFLGKDDPTVGAIFGFLDGRAANDLSTDNLIETSIDLGVQLPEQTSFGLQPQVSCYGTWQPGDPLPDRGVVITGPVKFKRDAQSNLSPNWGQSQEWYDPTGAGPYTSYVPLGAIPSVESSATLNLITANTPGVTAETAISQWTDTAGNTGITSRSYGLFAARQYEWRMNLQVNGSVTGDVVVVRIRRQVGVSPNIPTDPIVAMHKVQVPSGGDGAGFMCSSYHVATDAVQKFYCTIARFAGTGTEGMTVANGSGNSWRLVDVGIA